MNMIQSSRVTKHFGNVTIALISGPFADELNIPFLHEGGRVLHFLLSILSYRVSTAVVLRRKFAGSLLNPSVFPTTQS